MTRKLLLIEDHPEMAGMLSLRLRELFDDVDVATDGTTAMALLGSSAYQFIVLDLMLPDTSGIEVCRRVRAQKDYTPIIMVTAKASTSDRIEGLDAGADDYVTKPFNMEELLSRVRARLRRLDGWRLSSRNHSRVEVGGLAIQVAERRVEVDGTVVPLTAKEFDLLHLLASSPGRAYSRRELLQEVWGYQHEGYRHTVDTHVSRLRAKIEVNPAEPVLVETVWGVGYRVRSAEN